MKLLLTSAGVRNQTIANALISLLDTPLREVKVAVVPTAANVETGDKEWYYMQITNLQKHGFNNIEEVDIAAPGVDWKARLAEADVIFMSGGNTFYLLEQIRKTGFDVWLKEHIDEKVYVGASAGSIVATPSIAIASVDGGDVNIPGLTDLTGMSLVPFEVSPHTPGHVSHEGNNKYFETISNELYALDDESAIKVVDGEVEVISEGEWIKY